MSPEYIGEGSEAIALADLVPGRWARVAAVASSDGAHRMMAMGLTPGTRVRVERIAPLGDPLEIRLRGYSLLIRKSEAAHITVHID